jgi:hypothetical protein
VEGEQSAEPDPILIKHLLKAEALRGVLMTGTVASIAQRMDVTGS